MAVIGTEHATPADGTAGPARLGGGTLSGAGGADLDPDDGGGGRMTLYEHLAELRHRVLVCAGAIAVTSVLGWFLYQPVLSFMQRGYLSICHHHPSRFVTCNLVVQEPAQGFMTRLKLASYIGIALATPVWLWQLWRFLTPGLRKKEKQYALPFVLSACALFILGALVAVLVWPKALSWLISVSGNGVSTLYSLGSYVRLYTLICLIFGAVFLYPVVVVFLMVARVVPTSQWRKWRRIAIVVLCAVAAVVTPSNDPVTFLAMALPMVVLYELSILVGRVLHR
ncbi:MAG TPA: twin-arginine translocase subunit TatC [Acidimicrobiales bacterium]|nr:twin-arginine translocase subunit TatC [Acidimicrobiales bacterium]